MRAAWFENAGPADEVLNISDMPRPDPQDGEVLVRVVASGINPSDVKRRGGWRGTKPVPGRTIPHGDASGEIIAVGPGVSDERIGERVWTYSTSKRRTMGTAAEFVSLPEAQAVFLPDNASFETGACLGVPASTAYDTVFANGPVSGQTILVQGGAGSVGSLAIQFAKSGGARVISTVSSDEKAEIAKASGADHVINYRTEDVAAEVQSLVGANSLARIVEVDLAANMATDVELIAENGVIASYSSTSNGEPVLPYYPLAYKAATIRFVQAYLLTSDERLGANDAINRGLSEGWLVPLIAAALPLDQIAEAHKLVEAGSLGNVVVTP